MEEIVTILSTREWAITIWGTGFFIWMLTQSEIRKSLWNVIKILLGKNLRRFFLIIALYVAGITMIFYQLPFWNNIYLKDIILWLIFSGISYCVNSIIKGDTEHLKSTVKDNFTVFQMCMGKCYRIRNSVRFWRNWWTSESRDIRSITVTIIRIRIWYCIRNIHTRMPAVC